MAETSLLLAYGNLLSEIEGLVPLLSTCSDASTRKKDYQTLEKVVGLESKISLASLTAEQLKPSQDLLALYFQAKVSLWDEGMSAFLSYLLVLFNDLAKVSVPSGEIQQENLAKIQGLFKISAVKSELKSIEKRLQELSLIPGGVSASPEANSLAQRRAILLQQLPAQKPGKRH